jgi:hypothetical protein
MAISVSDEGMWANDCKREETISQGSTALLEALWTHHPRRMRMEFVCGRAVRPAPRRVDGRKPVDADNEQSPFAYTNLTTRPATGMALVQAVADAFVISYGELIGQDRGRRYVEARAVVVAVLRERGWSYPRIGKLLGGRDHSTVIHAHQSFDIHAKRKPLVAALFNRFRPEQPLPRAL